MFKKCLGILGIVLMLVGVLSAADVKLAWDANTPVPDGYKVYYGTTTGVYPSNVNAGNVVNTTITGLTFTTKYYFVVRAFNTAGESGNSNEVHSLLVTSAAATAITANGATVSWTTDEAGDTQVLYGTTTAYGSSTTLLAGLVTAHSATLTGLTSGTLYHFKVCSKNTTTGDGTLSNDYTFTTGTLPSPPVNVRIGF